jgi:hypothetical protein
MANSPPSANPANNGVLTGMMNVILNKFLQGLDDMLPAVVIAYDRVTNRAQVQPMILVVKTNNETVERARVASIPVMQFGGGGFMQNFPVKPGDLGWIKANDRDISIFLQGYNKSRPTVSRKHSFEDAVFIPNIMTGYTIAEEDADNLVLQNLAGTVKISLGANKIKIAAPTIEFVSTTLTHNGVNIGDTHEHIDVMAGADNTGPPDS